jgi:hypothetical protein
MGWLCGKGGGVDHGKQEWQVVVLVEGELGHQGLQENHEPLMGNNFRV